MTTEAASYETISGPEESDEEEEYGHVSKEDGLEEVAVTEEQKSAVGHKENVKVEGAQVGKELIKIEMDIHTHNGECTAPIVAVARAPAGAPLDSTSQTRNANGADWQEETYQKIKFMREMHLSELNDLHNKIASKVQKDPQNEKIERIKMFMLTLERVVLFLRLNKHDIQLTHKEKLFAVERHISFFLSSKRPCKPSSLLQGQLRQSSMQLQQPQSLGGQTNPPMQPVHGSMTAMQQNNFTNLQHLFLSGVNTVQPGYGVVTGILPQNPVNYSPQQVYISSLSSQSGTNPVQANLGSLHQNSSIPQQSLFELHEQQMFQYQQLRQMYQQMQQQTFHSQQLMQHQQLFHGQQLMQQQQAMQLQLMQQQQAIQQQIVQLRAHQQMNDANDLMMRQQMGMNTGVLQQQQSVGQHVESLHPLSPHQALSPQISCGLNSGAKLDERLVQVEERLEKIEAHSEKVETLLVDINKKLSYLVTMQDAKVSKDIKRPAKCMSSSWTGNGQSKRKHSVAEIITQSCKHRRLGRGDKAVIHPVASHDDCVENDQKKLEAEEPTS